MGHAKNMICDQEQQKFEEYKKTPAYQIDLIKSKQEDMKSIEFYIKALSNPILNIENTNPKLFEIMINDLRVLYDRNFL